MCIKMEFALITPPVGMNLYVNKGIIPDADIGEAFMGTLPFFILMFLGLPSNEDKLRNYIWRLLNGK